MIIPETGLAIEVPTYLGETRITSLPYLSDDFGEPSAKILIVEEDGVRLVLDTHDRHDPLAATVVIERRPGGWAIFMSPKGRGEESGLAFLLDDGRSAFRPEGLERGRMAALLDDDEFSDLDRFPKSVSELEQRR